MILDLDHCPKLRLCPRNWLWSRHCRVHLGLSSTILGPLVLLFLLCFPVVWESLSEAAAWLSLLGHFGDFALSLAFWEVRCRLSLLLGPPKLSGDFAVSVWKTGIRTLLSRTQICFSSALPNARERILFEFSFFPILWLYSRSSPFSWEFQVLEGRARMGSSFCSVSVIRSPEAINCWTHWSQVEKEGKSC